MKSLLIKDTTVDERMAIVKESLNFGDGECEGVDMDDSTTTTSSADESLPTSTVSSARCMPAR